MSLWPVYEFQPYDFSEFFNQTVTLWDGFTITTFALLCYCLSIAFSLFCYVFQGIGLFSMARQHRLKVAWLAWVPIANYYLIGRLADEIGAVNGSFTRKRVCLPVYRVFAYAASFGLLVYLPTAVQFLVQFAAYQYYREDYYYDPATSVAVILISSAIIITLAILYIVFLYRALYVIYKDYSPRNCGLMIVLCIFVKYAIGPCLFAVRKNPSQSAAYLNYMYQQQAAYQAQQTAYQPQQTYQAQQYNAPQQAPMVEQQLWNDDESDNGSAPKE